MIASFKSSHLTGIGGTLTSLSVMSENMKMFEKVI